MAESQSWVPLESTPDMLNKYINNLGAENLKFVEVMGLEPDMLQVSLPVFAVLLFFPFTDKAKGSPIGTVQEPDHDIYFIKQEIDNACRTIAIIHALANNQENAKYKDGSRFRAFFDATNGMAPQERARYLATDKNMGYDTSHGEAEDQSKAPSADEKVNMRCVTFVRKSGGLYELNGNYDGPVYHGTTAEDTLLEDAAEVIKKSLDGVEQDITILALVKKDNE